MLIKVWPLFVLAARDDDDDDDDGVNFLTVSILWQMEFLPESFPLGTRAIPAAANVKWRREEIVFVLHFWACTKDC